MNIKLLSYDEYSKEADIEFNIDEHSIIAYSPFLADKSLKKKYELIVFLPKNICKIKNKNNIIKLDDGFYSYNIIGKMVAKKMNIV